MVESRPIMSAEYPLSLLAKNEPPCSAVLSAIAELLVVREYSVLLYIVVQNLSIQLLSKSDLLLSTPM